ncbi:non-homologous end-joining DNA ligase [Hamadaea sp. NPDC051192]|uniref:non-homologous end-joining DNA ligase n=1 Tax=Hamadaea sp. NPDC051192 TaxID=3154940 RepID=UPI00341FAA7A
MSTSRPSWPPAVDPMLATAGPIPQGPGWAFEFKWDGIRAVASTSSTGGLRLVSRNNLDLTSSYPELAELGAYRSITLDGEIVALDPATGAPSFALLQRRMHVSRPSAALVAAVPVRYFAFDLLYRRTAVLSKPWTQRREGLEGLGLAGNALAVPPYFTGDGDDVQAAARQQRLEGVVAKRTDGVYEPGRRSRGWIKTPLFATAEAVVCGYTAGEGRRAGSLGALLLGAYDGDGRLRFIGHVGTGFSDKVLDQLMSLLKPLLRETSPYDEEVPRMYARKARWVEPDLVGEIVYRNVTPDGRLRHPSWRGLRPERRPAEARITW